MAYLSTSHSLRPARRSIFSFFAELAALRRQRAQLTRMSDAQLADIGVSRADALAEAARPVWDFPAAK